MRHRMETFKSPFGLAEIELDPDKKLWIPNNRSRVFVSTAIQEPELKIPAIDWGVQLQEMQRSMEEQIRRESMYMYAYIMDCSSSRSQHLGIPREPERDYRETRGRTYDPNWSNIERSTVPRFRRGSWGRDW